MNGLVFALVLLGFGLLIFSLLEARTVRSDDEPLEQEHEPEHDWQWSLDPDLNRERITRRR